MLFSFGQRELTLPTRAPRRAGSPLGLIVVPSINALGEGVKGWRGKSDWTGSRKEQTH